MEMQNFTDFTKKYECKKCNTICSRKTEWERHILTRKHKKSHGGNIEEINFTTKKIYSCYCGKTYNTNSRLWKHKKNCNKNDNEDNNNEIKSLTNLVLELVKSNNELQAQLINSCNINNSNIIHNNNNNNKTFNLQVFLNEECKDAMKLSEFINSLQVQLSDLDNMGSLGYTEGISKIILKEMNVIDQNKRPVHCTDIKRDILYVKDEDKWEKEQPEYPKLKQAIRKVEQKNFGLMGEWQAEHPDYKDSATFENTEYLNLVSHAMSGTPENMQKVIKKIAKEVVIEK